MAPIIFVAMEPGRNKEGDVLWRCCVSQITFVCAFYRTEGSSVGTIVVMEMCFWHT